MSQCLKNQELSDAGEQVESNIFIAESKNPPAYGCWGFVSGKCALTVLEGE